MQDNNTKFNIVSENRKEGGIMAQKIIITIGREFGSQGRKIGRMLADELGISFYDKNLITMAAEKTGIRQDLLDSADEKVVSRLLDAYAPTGMSYGTLNDRLYRTQAKIIKDIASSESCVIVGRLADYILKDYKNCIKIFIYAPFDKRVQTVMDRENLTEQQAKKLTKKMDKIRKSYYQLYADRSWNQKEGKHILIDSSLLGVEKTVEYLKDLVQLVLEEDEWITFEEKPAE